VSAEIPHGAIHPTTRDAWRAWLEAHPARPDGVWLVSNKKATGRSRIPYDEAVEALEVPDDMARALSAYPSAASLDTMA
jgi:uncharacterized protein YdeI (YjbR/CyaY-like superfamily)